MGSEVYVPCPISITGITNVTLPARSMRRKAFGANGASVVRLSRISPRAGSPNPSTSPPPIAAVAVTLRKARREEDTAPRFSIDAVFISPLLAVDVTGLFGSGNAGGLLDRGPDARIGPAAADVARHCVVDIRVARFRLGCQQRAGRHDLAGLAVAALGHVERE